MARHPNLAGLPDEALTRLLCPRCHAHVGEWACDACRGTGLCCPYCQGAEWVRDALGHPGRPGQLARCPLGCRADDWPATIQIIMRYVQVQSARPAPAAGVAG